MTKYLRVKNIRTIFALYKTNDMRNIKVLVKMLRGAFNIITVLLFFVYLYGIYGFCEAARGRNTLGVEYYVTPLIWNFVMIVLTIIPLLCWIF